MSIKPQSIGENSSQQLDLYLREGADFGPYTITMINPDKSPVDLAGVVVDAQVRTSFDQPDPPTASFDISIDAPNGVITMSLPDTVTETLGFHYVWDLRVTWADGKIEFFIFGDIRVLRRVTR